MAAPVIQTSFASGEWAPKLRSRVDVQKWHSGASLLRNFYVDWSGGGASTRQGTQFIANVGASGARLIPFQASASVSYVLEFGQFYIRFFSNSAQITSGGNPYQIGSPYRTADLFPSSTNQGLKFTQLGTQMLITHPNYQAQILTLVTATNWTLTQATFGTTLASPTISSLTTTLGASPSKWNYNYQVTAVDSNGQESIASTATPLTGFNSLSDATAPGTNDLVWTAVTGAVSYNVYKALPTFNTAIAIGAPYGFIGNTTALSFQDATPGIGPDFSQTPPIAENPFTGAGVVSYTVTNQGAYTTVPAVTVSGGAGTGAQALASLGVISIASINNGGTGWSVGNLISPDSTHPTNGVVLQVATTGAGGSITSLTIIGPGSITGVGSSVLTNPVVGWSPGGGAVSISLNWGVTQVFVSNQGTGYTSAPTVAFSAGAAAATAVLGSTSAGNPGVCGLFQERLVLAAQPMNVQGFNFSQPSSFFNYNVSFVSQADDAITGTIVDGELNEIRSLISVPTGELALTGKAGWLLNGGGGISTTNPISPTNITAQPQAFNGASYLSPLKVNYNILYSTNKGNYVRDLSYNIWAQLFTGQDITTYSNHLFFSYFTIDWAWAEEPFKTVWAVRNDGQLLSLAYVKEQELIGWAHHDTNGYFKSVCAVSEVNTSGLNGVVDAVYFIVERVLNGTTVQCVERMADRFFFSGYFDSWSVDCGLSTTAQVSTTVPVVIAGDARTVGNVVTLTDTTDAPFTAAMATNNWLFLAVGGIYKITGFTSSSVVTASVVRTPLFINSYTGTPQAANGALWQPVTSVSGLSYLANMAVVGVSDGVAFTGTVSNTGTLTVPLGSVIRVGLAYTPQLQTLPLDLGTEPTAQGRRKKISAVTLRVADTLGLSIGTTFNNLVTMKDFVLNNIGTQSNAQVTALINGDGRTILDQVWQEPGTICIQQNQPYPATILGVIPEVTMGDEAPRAK